jgi:hypothetical protein
MEGFIGEVFQETAELRQRLDDLAGRADAAGGDDPAEAVGAPDPDGGTHEEPDGASVGRTAAGSPAYGALQLRRFDAPEEYALPADLTKVKVPVRDAQSAAVLKYLAVSALIEAGVVPKESVEFDTDGKLHLVGDAATPGKTKYYGTDASGTSGAKGFHSLADVIDAVMLALGTSMTNPGHVLGRKVVGSTVTYGWVATTDHADEHPE